MTTENMESHKGKGSESLNTVGAELFFLYFFFIPTVQFTFKQKSKQLDINLVRPYTLSCV